jgi:hypothetical protein
MFWSGALFRWGRCLQRSAARYRTARRAKAVFLRSRERGQMVATEGLRVIEKAGSDAPRLKIGLVESSGHPLQKLVADQSSQIFLQF